MYDDVGSVEMRESLCQIRSWHDILKDTPYEEEPLDVFDDSNVEENELSRTDTHKCLGVRIDEKLNHIDMICKKASAGIGAMFVPLFL